MRENTYKKSINTEKTDLTVRGISHDFSVSPAIEKIESIIDGLKKEGISFESVIDLLKKKDAAKRVISIPLSLLSNRKLGVLEILSRYLKDEKGFSYHKIAVLLKRDDRTIWGAYNKSTKKMKKMPGIIEAGISVPIEVFKDRRFGPLESVIIHLKDHESLSYHKIADLLKRDDRTVWTAYNQAKRKSDRGASDE